MKDSLKEFIDTNRQAFDHLEPSNSSWNKIERNVPRKSRSLWNNVHVWRVAAMLSLGLSMYLFTAEQYTPISLRGKPPNYKANSRIWKIL
ncbi:MAG: hypothetical protein U5K54_18055 [Cytophagales bacterium]|nr:hypothetical protein [Cytophagales bacterium]